jgi:ABC-2 type transport system permease protein
MHSFLSFVSKEFKHIFRDKKTLVVLFGIPIMQILIFGFVISYDFKDIGVAVFDQANDSHSQRISTKIFSSGYFIEQEEIETEKQIEQRFRSGKVRAVVVFPEGFSKSLENDNYSEIQVITDASDPNLANAIVNYLSGIIRQYQQEIQYVSGDSPILSAEIRMVYNENLEGPFMFVPGTMAMILMIICALLTSISVTREKELGTMEVLLVSPLRPTQIIIGKVTPYILLAFINAIVILLMGTMVFGLPINGSALLLMAELLLYIFLALSLGMFISTVAKSQQVAMFISLFALMLPTILLSGFIYPIENMPKILQLISTIIPPRWFIIIIKDIMLKGNGIAYVWQETLILMAITTIFILGSIKKFQIRMG